MYICSFNIVYFSISEKSHHICAWRSDGGGSNGRRTLRVKSLTDAQRDEIQAMSDPKDMAPAERKRQFAALDRYINANAEGMPPGLVEKYKDSFGSGTKKFELLTLGNNWHVLFAATFRICSYNMMQSHVYCHPGRRGFLTRR